MVTLRAKEWKSPKESSQNITTTGYMQSAEAMQKDKAHRKRVITVQNKSK